MLLMLLIEVFKKIAMTRVCVVTFTAFVDCHIYEANAEVGGSNPGQGQKSALVNLNQFGPKCFFISLN